MHTLPQISICFTKESMTVTHEGKNELFVAFNRKLP